MTSDDHRRSNVPEALDEASGDAAPPGPPRGPVAAARPRAIAAWTFCAPSAPSPLPATDPAWRDFLDAGKAMELADPGAGEPDVAEATGVASGTDWQAWLLDSPPRS